MLAAAAAGGGGGGGRSGAGVAGGASVPAADGSRRARDGPRGRRARSRLRLLITHQEPFHSNLYSISYVCVAYTASNTNVCVWPPRARLSL